MRRVFLIFFLVYFWSNSGWGQGTVYQDSVIYDTWSETDTVWYVNYRYRAEVNPDYQLKLNIPKNNELFALGYDAVSIDWGDGGYETNIAVVDTCRKVHVYAEGRWCLRIILSSLTSPGLPVKVYRCIVYNRDLGKGSVQILRWGKDRCMAYEQDTFWVKLTGNEENPPTTIYTPIYDVSAELANEIVAASDTLLMIDTTGVKDEYMVIMKQPVGQYRLTMGFHMICQDQNSKYYLFNNSDQTPVYLYAKPDVNKIFDFDYKSVEDIELCSGSELMTCNDVYNRMYMDWYGVPSYENSVQFRVTFYSKELPDDPDWQVLSVTGDETVVDSAKLIFNKAGFYRVKIEAYNECGLDSLVTDSIQDSNDKRLIKVFQSGENLLFCQTHSACIEDLKDIDFIDKAPRIPGEGTPEYAFTISSADGKLMEGDDFYINKIQIYKADTEITAAEAEAEGCDSTYIRLKILKAGNFKVGFYRKNSVCDTVYTMFNVALGGKPILSQNLLVDSLITGYGMEFLGGVAVKCDTFSYVLQDFRPGIDSNNLTVDSIAFIFAKATAPKDTLIYQAGVPKVYHFDSLAEKENYFELRARNYCGWSDKQVLRFYNYVKPDVELIREKLKDNDTLCLGFDYSYEVKGTLPPSYYLEMKYTKLNAAAQPEGEPVVEMPALTWAHRYTEAGMTEERLTIQHGLDPRGCFQQLIDTVFTVVAPDVFSYEDSVRYCDAETEVQVADLFGEDTEGYKWAEWSWGKKDAVWNYGAALPASLTYTPGVKDTLCVKLSKSNGCYVNDTLVFIPKEEPDLSVLKGNDTICVFGDVQYPVWAPATIVFPMQPDIRVDLEVQAYVEGDYAAIARERNIGGDYFLSLNTLSPDSLKIIYKGYNAVVDDKNSCKKEVSRMLYLEKPYLHITKTDTLRAPGVYDFNDISGYIESRGIDGTSLVWNKAANLSGTITGTLFSLSGNDNNRDSLVFYLKGTVAGGYCQGQEVMDSLVVFNPRPQMHGHFEYLCDNASSLLWGPGKAYGYFLEENKLKWKIVNEGNDWGKVEPNVGFNVHYTPVSGKRTGLGDTVKIQMCYDDVLFDTVYIKVNAALEWTLSQDTLIARDRQVNVYHIDPDFFACKNYQRLIFDRTAVVSNDAFIKEDSILDFSGNTDLYFPRNYEKEVKIKMKAFPGCTDAETGTIRVIDLVFAQPQVMPLRTFCEGDSIKITDLFGFEVADLYTTYEWKKIGGDGAFNPDSSWYYVSGNGNDHKVEVTTRKVCVFYDGAVADENFRKESLESAAFDTYHNPGLSVDMERDTLCMGTQQVENVWTTWGVHLERPEYQLRYLRLNGQLLGASDKYIFPKNAGEIDTVVVSADLLVCRHMDWQIRDTVFAYQQRPMVSGDFEVPELCGDLWREIESGTLHLVDYTDYSWSGSGVELETEGLGLKPKIRGKDDQTSGMITLTIRAPQECPPQLVTKVVSRTLMPEISLQDRILCPESGVLVHIPIRYVKERENIDKIEWRVKGVDDPFVITNKDDWTIDYTLLPADVMKDSVEIMAGIYSVGKCASFIIQDSMKIGFRKLPVIILPEVDPVVCQGDSLKLTDLTSVTNSDEISWKIISGIGILENGFYRPQEAQGAIQLQVDAKAQYGCNFNASDILNVRVEEAAVPVDFAVSEPRCPGSELTFTVVNDGTVGYSWDFADGSALVNGTACQHRYELAGVYPVTLTAHYANACQRSLVKEVAVGALLKAGLKIVPEADDCSQIVRYVENTTQGGWTYGKINWGDTEEWQNIEGGRVEVLGHRFTNDSTVIRTYPIRLIVGNECQEDTTAISLQVYPLVVKARMGFSDRPEYGKCFGQDWGFLNRSLGFGETGYEAVWTFEPGMAYKQTAYTDTLVGHRFLSPGHYTVTLKVQDKCNSDEISQVVEVQGNDKLDFEISGDLHCSGQAVTMRVGQEFKSDFSAYKWEFDDNSLAIAGKDSITHLFAAGGVFKVKLTANALSDGYCPAEKEKEILVRKTPVAEIKADPMTRGCAPDTVRFSRVFHGDEGDPAEQIYWNFGNGVTSSLNDVEKVIFIDPGKYEVFLRITSGEGCVDSSRTIMTTLETPVAAFAVSDTLFCTDDGNVRIDLDNRTIEPEKSSFEWSYNGTLFSRLEQPGSLVPEAAFGKIRIQLKAYHNETRCPDVFVKEVISSRIVKADFSISPHEICDATPVHFESTSLHGDQAEWDMGDGHISSEAEFDYIYDGAGIYTIKMVANNADGCASSKAETVIVYPLPKADFIWDIDNTVTGMPEHTPLPEVNNGGISFSNLSEIYQKDWGDSLRYEWNFGDGSGISVKKSPQHRYPNNGLYEVVLKAITQFGCVDSTSENLSVSAVKGLYIPTAFAPAMPDEGMGDGRDYRGVSRFLPKGVGLYSYKIQIYGPRGECVWSSDKLEDGRPTEYWDGTFNGGLAPKGTYTWKVNAIFIDGSVWNNDGGKTEGTLILIR